MSATVRDMLRGKSDVYSVGPGDTVFDALRLMADKNIGAVLVRSDGRSTASSPRGTTRGR